MGELAALNGVHRYGSRAGRNGLMLDSIAHYLATAGM
jgi:hypothetical protein